MCLSSGLRDSVPTMSRPGFGSRHPELVTLLESLTPDATQHDSWANGALPLRISAYLSQRRIPDEVVTSVRCLVEVGDQIVLTESPDDVNVWPGGRREPGETMRETAVREVHEETGWQVDPESLQLMGFLHLVRLVPAPADDRYPHPDFVQLVFRGQAPQRTDDGWKDLDGYVLRSWLEEPAKARQLALAPVSLPFLDALRG